MGKIDTLKKVAFDPRWWNFYIQRRFTNPSQRTRIADRIARSKPSATLIDRDRSVRAAEDLKTSGLHRLGSLLSPEKCTELVSYFESKDVTDPYRPSVPPFLPLSSRRPAEAHIAHHSANDIVEAPYLVELANDPRIIDAVSGFLGCKPTIGYMATWWSYATSTGPQQAENFHRDVDDWRFVKLFVYLTEVTSERGPHKYVLYSSPTPRLTVIRRYQDDEVQSAFGADNILTMTAQPGEGFLEDTYGLHKGQPVQSGRRLLFQVMYTLSGTPYAPKVPVGSFSARGSNGDAWTNRFYLK